jgi:hypothetical protein
LTLRHSIQKIEAALELVKEFKAIKFPHPDSTAAINEVAKLLEKHKELLNDAKDETLSQETQTGSNSFVSEALEMLGVVANSANVRNAFEVHGPVLEMARNVIGDRGTALILTFEWDYQPYTVPQNHPQFPRFVIIGLPASEASNALVLPAVGHELGHVLWLKQDMKTALAPRVNEETIKLIKSKYRDKYQALFKISADDAGSEEIDNTSTWGQAAEYCLRQIEEIFCDFAGLFLFGRCYLECFEYMLSPALHQMRAPEYPTVKVRAEVLASNSVKIGVAAHINFEEQFAAQKSPFEDADEKFFDRDTEMFELELADEVARAMANEIADRVFTLCRDRGLAPPDSESAEDIKEHFLKGVPAEKTAGLGQIANAGWLTYEDANFMAGEPNQQRMAALNELVLKSIEIYEIERIMHRAA